VSAFLFGLITGIMVGWAAAPAVVWRTPKEQVPKGQVPTEEAPKKEAPEPVLPYAVGIAGGL
jgi:hypothetical protein